MAKLSLLPEFENTPLNELASQIKPQWLAVANEYLNNGGNALGAYRTVYEQDESIKRLPEGGTPNEIRNNLASRAEYVLNLPTVSAYVLRTRERRNLEAVASSDRSYSAWYEELHDTSQEAREDRQYSASIRGQEILGKASGHVDANRVSDASRMGDDQLSALVAVALGVTVKALNERAPISNNGATIIDGEVVSDKGKLTHQ